MTESDRRESERGKYALGAQFIASPDGPMFVYAIDANNVIGPRKATNSDKREHAGEWATFEAQQAAEGPHSAFDHDGDGHEGGSLPKAKREYRRKV